MTVCTSPRKSRSLTPVETIIDSNDSGVVSRMSGRVEVCIRRRTEVVTSPCHTLTVRPIHPA